MRQIHTALLIPYFLLFTLAPSVAQNLEKFMRATNMESGMLYFVLPQKMKRVEGKNLAKKKLEYDYTYVSNADSVRLLLTLSTRSAFRGDSLYIATPLVKALPVPAAKCHYFGFPLKTIFKEPRGKYWVNRMEAWLPFAQWKSFYSAENPLIFSFSLEKPYDIQYALIGRKCRKQRENYRLFFDMLELNQ